MKGKGRGKRKFEEMCFTEPREQSFGETVGNGHSQITQLKELFRRGKQSPQCIDGSLRKKRESSRKTNLGAK